MRDWLAAWLFMLVGYAGIASGAQAAQFELSIPTLPMGAALQELARQSGIQIIFFSQSTDGLEAVAVQGRVSIDEALTRMLGGSRLVYQQVNATTFQVRPATVGRVAVPAPAQSGRSPAAATQALGPVDLAAAVAPDLPGASAGPAVQSEPAMELREVIVTGSRVITRDDDSPAPVTRVTAHELATARPGNMADALYDLPAFTQTRNQTTNPGAGGGSAANAAANNAINTMNMRALGSSRTLVLYNGKRLPAVSPEGWVDVNLIPQMLLNRVETVTGGASAVYGSDAIGGVVNFISDRAFDGIKGELRGGRSGFGDGNVVAGGIALGQSVFGGRGHFLAAYSTSNDAGVDSRLSRPWGRRVPTVQGDGLTRPYYILLDARSNNASFGGKINSVTGVSTLTTAMQFDSGGYPVPFDPGLRGTANGVYRPDHQLGGDGGYQNSTLRSQLDLHSLSARIEYDFSGMLHGFVDASSLYAFSSQALGYNTLAPNTGFSGQNPFLAAGFRFAGSFTMGKFLTGLPRQSTESYLHESYVLAGLSGRLQNGYQWNVAANSGRGAQNTRWLHHFNIQKLAAALDAVTGSSGRVVCFAATQAATAVSYADCAPLNAFGANSESGAAVSYVTATIADRLTNTSQGLSADVTGAPFTLAAGPVNVALSIEWRVSTYEAASNSQPVDRGGRADCNGLRTFGGTQCGGNTTLLQVAVADRPRVSQAVTEAALEANIPLLKSVRLAKSLGANLAARHALYRNSDGAESRPHFDSTTWKAGVVWDLSTALTLRATRSRDFRAPNLDELYRPVAVGVNNGPVVTNFNLPVAVGGAQTLTGGNDTLRPEQADATTVGVVYRATPTLSIALDGFDFRVHDAIFFLNGAGSAVAMTCMANPAAAVCDFLQRNSAGAVTVIKTGNINAAQLETYGVDLEANWRAELFDRPLSVRGLLTWQPHFFHDIPGTPRLDESGVAASFGQAAVGGRVRATATLSYRPSETMSVTLSERWRSRLSLTDTDGFASEAVASVAYTSLNLSFAPKIGAAQLDLFVNVQNLFNRQSPYAHPGPGVAPGSFGGVAPGDDVMGRFYTAGVRMQL